MSFQKLFVDGFRLINGTTLNNIFNAVTTVPAMTITTLTAPTTTITTETVTTLNETDVNQAIGGVTKIAPRILTAAGTTQLGATAIVGSKAIVTVAATASTHGVRLPTAATGLEVTVANVGAFGCKVYPATNGKIGAASTNAADSTVLAVNKANRYIAVNTTLWAVQRGA